MSDGHKLVPVGDDKASSFTKVCVHPSKKKGLSELHTYPVGIVDHALGLEGKPGVTTLVDITNPANPKTQDGQPLAWDSFRVADGKLTVDGEGHWDAFPGPKQGDWTIKWNDGACLTIWRSDSCCSLVCFSSPRPPPSRAPVHQLTCI